MFNRLKTFPLHPLLLAVYPVLALFANNVTEVSADVLPRPLIIALALALGLLLLARLAVRSWGKAALVVSFTLVLFFSYGHVYELKKTLPVLTGVLRHRYLFPIFIAAFFAGSLFLLRWRDPLRLTPVVNLVAAALLIVPLLQIGAHALTATRADRQAAEAGLSIRDLSPSPNQPLPSVYFILLDTYMRSDALQRDMGYDNSAFVTRLEEMGFYVPPCSRSNYTYTQASMVSALNLDYIDAITAELQDNGLEPDIFSLIKHSRVRSQLENLGYRTVAFDSGYEWSRLHDADVYLGLNRDTFAMQNLSRFEALLIKSTALRVYTDNAIRQNQTGLAQANSPFSEHIELERFILARLPELARDPSPKFVFAHVLIPHWPYVFLPDGSIRSDPAFDQDNLSDEQIRQGYVDSVAFLNSRLTGLLQQILDESATPPVIVVFGDHGLKGDNRLQNFTAIYLPGGSDGISPAITPANTFRVVFNHVFDAGYELLPDLSYADVDPGDAEDMRVFLETAPACLP